MTRRSLNSPSRKRLVNCLAEGALTAFLGVATVAMLVLLLWIASPYPHGGPGDALRIAAGVWLLAHGVELVRTETLGGGSAPVGLTPLLLTVLPVMLLYRVARAARSADGAAWRIVLWLSVGYLLIAGLACWYAFDGPLRVDLLSAAVRLPLLTVLPLCVGVWAAQGWPQPSSALLRMPNWLPWGRVFTALRAAVAALAVLCAGGALLVVVALGLHWGAAGDAFGQLAAAWSGRVAVLLLCLALAPNAALWAASYGLGPGFTIGGGSAIGPLAASGYPQLPHFPLLAAVPAEGSGDPLVLAAVAVVPVSAGLVAGWFTARGCAPVRGSDHGSAGALGTMGTALLAALGCGLGLALLAVFAGGALGTGELAGLGPNWWVNGAASFGWTALLALPTAVWVRWWRLREPRPLLAMAIGGRRCVTWTVGLWPRRRPRVRPESDWHATGSRLSRWAALKQASGGLMPDLGATEQEHTVKPEKPEKPEKPVKRVKSSVRAATADEFAMPTTTVRPRPPAQPLSTSLGDPMARLRAVGLRDLPAPAELSRFEDAATPAAPPPEADAAVPDTARDAEPADGQGDGAKRSD